MADDTPLPPPNPPRLAQKPPRPNPPNPPRLQVRNIDQPTTARASLRPPHSD